MLTITRDDVLTAIDKEYLRCGGWINLSNCTYCAVGAVIAGRGIAQADVARVAGRVTEYRCNDDDSLPTELANKNWLGALSIKWEQLGYKLAQHEGTIPTMLTSSQLEGLKPTLKEWVLEHLPEGLLFEGDIA